MDLSTLTPQQRACVEHVDGPLLVSAGAGSGKTFMLTQRIAYALLNPEISGVTDIDQVLAITFTEAAAAEIKARVRNKLRQEHMPEQALKVDACWISTIHGMCSRILHENALELGLDPAFGLIGDVDKNRLLAACVDEAIRSSCGQFDAFFDEYDKDQAHNMVLSLLGKAANVRGGLDSVVMAPIMPARDIAQEMYEAIIDIDTAARGGIGKDGKPTNKFTPAVRDMAEGPYGIRTFDRLRCQDNPSYAEVYGCIFDNPSPSTTAGGFELAGYVFRQSLARLLAECEMGLAVTAREGLYALACEVKRLYEQHKSAMGMLDQDDLITKTLDAFEKLPEVEARYRDRFRLIMVDEFQDTSELQIALISHLTDGDRRLCTVGDTQQSIYRFRGADVSTYLAHKRHMRELEGSGGLTCELDRNFRSHGDIIRFVNKVFSQERVFGSNEFIKLGFDEKHAENPRNAFPDVPRIEIVATASNSSTSTKNAKADDRIAYEAEAIAKRFCALHETGSANCRWADMVILLGRMTNAEVYARALRRHGAPCTITGGSGFKDTVEARTVASLCAALANPLDNAAMDIALTSEVFGLGCDELLTLATSPEGTRRSFWHGMLDSLEEQRTGSRGDAPTPRIRLAARVFAHAARKVGASQMSVCLNEIAVESGYLSRLQEQGPQGMAQAANFFKALRMVEGIERENPLAGPAQVSLIYSQTIDGGITERPGSLNTDEQDAVRILTTHSSKGLEYPIVALADFNGSNGGRPSPLTLECANGRLYLSLKPSNSKPETEREKALALSESMVNGLIEAGLFEEPRAIDDEDITAGGMGASLKAYHDAEELAEQRRKFYVGATRPREALIIAVNYSDSSTQMKKADCINDLRCSLFGQDGPWRSVQEGIDYGGTTPAIVNYAKLVLDADGNVVVEGREADGPLPGTETAPADMPATCTVPEAPACGEYLSDLEPMRLPYNPAQAATFSYSSIAAHDPAADQEDWVGVRPADTDEASPVVPAQPRHASATAFGSALHQACQLMAEDLAWRKRQGSNVGEATFTMPPDERLRACLATWGVPAAELGALKDACRLWLASDAAHEAASFSTLTPEAPFYAALQGTQGEPIHLEGAMDLLCHDGPAPHGNPRRAFIVDYKTGGLASETADELRAKPDLQARCYAYVALSQGFDEVELAFVRVEQPDPACPDKPQEVRYRFSGADEQALHELIRERYARL